MKINKGSVHRSNGKREKASGLNVYEKMFDTYRTGYGYGYGDMEKELDSYEEEVREDKAGLFEKGVKNVGIGVALALFLGFMTGEVWMGCIGLFVVANGVSQLLTYYKYKPLKKPENSTDTNKSIFDNIQED